MAVIGIDIGDHSTYISVARLGAVETISNDYSLRASPSVVGFGERQRYIGVAAENQRNLNPKSTVSFFKNTLGRKFKDVAALQHKFGAAVSTTDSGRLQFEVREGVRVGPEQALAMLLTKAKELVDEEVETCVISVPLYFTQAQRQAVRDAAEIAGLPLTEIITDMAALCLSYGKGRELGEEERHVVFVDCGAEGTQAALAAVNKQGAKILASSANHTAGKAFDQLLVDHAIQLIEEKYKKNLRDNAKALNKLRNALEKAKKQMSANTNPIPVQLDSLVDDTDVQFSLDRATFEDLIRPQVAEIKDTLENLLASTTVKTEQIHSVEVVGGSTRIPLVKATVQQVFGRAPSTTLNADEEVSRGCALTAAGLSAKFITKQFKVEEAVHYGVEAMFVSGGQHEKMMICDEGESRGRERRLEIKADFPVNIMLQYVEEAEVEDKLIGLYKVEKEDPTTAGLLDLKFQFDQHGLLALRETLLVSEARRKRRKSENNNEAEEAEEELEMVPCRTVLACHQSLPERLAVAELAAEERRMVSADQEEVRRQEEKNRLEEELYRLRNQLLDRPVDTEEAFTSLKAYFDEIETWLYEEGEEAPRSTYTATLQAIQAKMKVYTVWLDKWTQMKAREEEKARFMQQQTRHTREIPVVYEGDHNYVPKQRSHPFHPAAAAGFASRPDPFPRDPFQRGFGRSQFFDDQMFGW